ncbi:uncharacterized protein FRV6_16910 [Fusarium oxysporum]|uniref:Uncharacterized protein n=1 Tax=Fusarium oxysporum TaxID=5507 RepID=A0A2H3TVX6_FUSOX|nr:uncharacterized protein FRV6_16910 [Fusarium oxysporum]
MTNSSPQPPNRVKKEESPDENCSNSYPVFPQGNYYLRDAEGENDWKYEERDGTTDESEEADRKVEPSESGSEVEDFEAKASRASSSNLGASSRQTSPAYPISEINRGHLSQSASSDSPLSDLGTISSMPESLTDDEVHQSPGSTDPAASGDSEGTCDLVEEDSYSVSSGNYTEDSGENQNNVKGTDQNIPLRSVAGSSKLPTGSQFQTVFVKGKSAVTMRYDACPQCYQRKRIGSHVPDNCPDNLRPCSECQETHGKSDKYTDFELRCHRQKCHKPVVSLPQFTPWSLDEENKLRELENENRGHWEEINDQLPGRTSVACKKRFRRIKPKGYRVFNIKVDHETQENTLNGIYCGIFHCCYRIAKSLAISWEKAFSRSTYDWPTDVRKITNGDPCFTQNELTALLRYFLRLAVAGHPAAQEATVTVEGLIDEAMEMLKKEGSRGSPASMAATEALNMLLDLARWEMDIQALKRKSDDVVPFELTLKVQCGEESMLHDRLEICFQSESTFEECAFIHPPEVLRTLQIWTDAKLKERNARVRVEDRLTRDDILERADTLLDKAKKLSHDNQSSLERNQHEDAGSVDHPNDTFLEFIKAELSVFSYRQARDILILLRQASSSGTRQSKHQGNPLWWPEEPFDPWANKSKKELTDLLASLFFSITRETTAKVYFGDLAMLTKYALVALLMRDGNPKQFCALWAVHLVGDIPLVYWGHCTRQDQCLLKSAQHGATILTDNENKGHYALGAKPHGNGDASDKDDRLTDELLKVFEKFLGIKRKTWKSLGARASRYFKKGHSGKCGTGPSPAAWPKGIPWESKWHDDLNNCRVLFARYTVACIREGNTPEVLKLISKVKTKPEEKKFVVNLESEVKNIAQEEEDRQNQALSGSGLEETELEILDESTQLSGRKRTISDAKDQGRAKRRRPLTLDRESSREHQEKKMALSLISGCMSVIFTEAGVTDPRIMNLMSKLQRGETFVEKTTTMIEILESLNKDFFGTAVE